MRSGSELRKALAEKFDDELRFFRGWIDKPKAVGSIIPTSSFTARRMASVVDTTSGLPVLEIGPGTGVITRAILARGVPPEKLYTVEYSADFVRHLRRNFPRVNVIEGDAFDLDATLGKGAPKCFDSVVSGVPLLNFPVPQPCRLYRRPARPHSQGPADRPAYLRAEVAGAARPRQLHGPAFRFRHPQHPADAALGLRARTTELRPAAGMRTKANRPTNPSMVDLTGDLPEPPCEQKERQC